jgi:hypothetical protein
MPDPRTNAKLSNTSVTWNSRLSLRGYRQELEATLRENRERREWLEWQIRRAEKRMAEVRARLTGAGG